MAHPFDRNGLAPAVPYRQGRFIFANPYGKGDICAAGVLPVIKDEASGALRVLLGEEDMRSQEGSSREWTPALAIVGGKVDGGDMHWLGSTVVREVREETGGLLSAEAVQHCADFDPRCIDALPSDKAFSFYVPFSKYQVVVYPVPRHLESEWLALPARYAEAFGGLVPPPPAARSANKLHWVQLIDEEASRLNSHNRFDEEGSPSKRPRGGTAGSSTSSRGRWRFEPVVHECSTGKPEECAARCGRAVRSGVCPCPVKGLPLPLKRELAGAMALDELGALVSELMK